MIKDTAPVAGKKPADTHTQKELMARWHCSLRTVQREIRRWGLPAADYIGMQPIFTTADVQGLEERRKAGRDAQRGFTPARSRILTVREAKRLAGRKGGK